MNDQAIEQSVIVKNIGGWKKGELSSIGCRWHPSLPAVSDVRFRGAMEVDPDDGSAIEFPRTFKSRNEAPTI